LLVNLVLLQFSALACCDVTNTEANYTTKYSSSLPFFFFFFFSRKRKLQLGGIGLTIIATLSINKNRKGPDQMMGPWHHGHLVASVTSGKLYADLPDCMQEEKNRHWWSTKMHCHLITREEKVPTVHVTLAGSLFFIPMRRRVVLMQRRLITRRKLAFPTSPDGCKSF
jgi:hypothetical protein